jgi:hypothetical protein
MLNSRIAKLPLCLVGPKKILLYHNCFLGSILCSYSHMFIDPYTQPITNDPIFKQLQSLNYDNADNDNPIRLLAGKVARSSSSLIVFLIYFEPYESTHSQIPTCYSRSPNTTERITDYHAWLYTMKS